MPNVVRRTFIFAFVVFSTCLNANDDCLRYYRNFTTSPLLSHTHEQVVQSVREGKDPRFVSIVVPVYRELANGNIIRLLENFSQQGAATRKDDAPIHDIRGQFGGRLRGHGCNGWRGHRADPPDGIPRRGPGMGPFA